MKIIYLYGDNDEKIYMRLSAFRDKAIKDKLLINDLDELVSNDQISNQTLFNNRVINFLYNFRSIKIEILTNLIKYSNPEDILVITADNPPNSAVKNIIGKEVIYEQFQYPKIIWSFLEEIYPGNVKIIIKLMYEIKDKIASELIFHLISKQIRDMIWSIEGNMEIPEWRKHKLNNQAKHYSRELLLNILDKLADIDIKIKSSKTDMFSELDFLFITQLQ